jgi:hypothetical protein
MANSREHSNEPFSSTKCRKFLNQVKMFHGVSHTKINTNCFIQCPLLNTTMDTVCKGSRVPI